MTLMIKKCYFKVTKSERFIYTDYFLSYMFKKIALGIAGLGLILSAEAQTLEQRTEDFDSSRKEFRKKQEILMQEFREKSNTFYDKRLSGDDPNKKMREQYNSLKSEFDKLYDSMQKGSDVAKIISNYIKEGYYTHSLGNTKSDLDIESKRFRLTMGDEKDLRAYFLMTHIEDIIKGKNIEKEGNIRNLSSNSFSYKITGINLIDGKYGFGIIFDGRYKGKDAEMLNYKLELDVNEIKELNELSKLGQKLEYSKFLLER